MYIPGRGRVLDDGLDLSVVVAEPDMVGTVLLHGDCPLEWTVTQSERDACGGGLLDGLTGLVV